jgi:hypothetical protein
MGRSRDIRRPEGKGKGERSREGSMVYAKAGASHQSEIEATYD